MAVLVFMQKQRYNFTLFTAIRIKQDVLFIHKVNYLNFL